MPARLLVALCALLAPVRGSTPYNPNGTVFDHSLGGHLATTVLQFDQINAPLTGLTPNATAASYEITPNSTCDPKLGYLWRPKNGISRSQPISLYYTARGQLAGMRLELYGKRAVQGRLVSEGYWIPTGEPNQWYISVSFRAPEAMCSEEPLADSEELLGDRLVVNQDGIAKSIPSTATEAAEMHFMPGSCVIGMGQHWFYDLELAPGNSWNSSNLMPISPMYNMDDGKFNAFMFSAPLCQGPEGRGSYMPYNWDNTASPLGCALPPNLMCQNFCTDECPIYSLLGFQPNPWESSGTEYYSTLHVFFNENPESEPKCLDESGNPVGYQWGNPAGSLVDRTCPANTAEMHSNRPTLLALLLRLVGAVLVGVLVTVVYRGMPEEPPTLWEQTKTVLARVTGLGGSKFSLAGDRRSGSSRSSSVVQIHTASPTEAYTAIQALSTTSSSTLTQMLVQQLQATNYTGPMPTMITTVVQSVSGADSGTSGGSESMTLVIAVSVAGGLVLVAALVVGALVYLWRRNKRSAGTTGWDQPEFMVNPMYQSREQTETVGDVRNKRGSVVDIMIRPNPTVIDSDSLPAAAQPDRSDTLDRLVVNPLNPTR